MSETGKAVFLSYASQDTDAARRIAEALRAEGIEVWFDVSELRGGEAWDASIQKQIAECSVFVAIISANTQSRREGYFRLEWRLADERMRLMAEGTPFVLPVIIDGTKERDALVPKSFLGVQWTWLPHGEVPPAFVARVQKLLGAVEVPAAAAAISSAVSESPRPVTPDTSLARKRRDPLRLDWLRLLPWAFCAAFAIGMAWLSLRPRPSSPSLSIRTSIDLPNGAQLTRATTGFHLGPSSLALAVSPDGKSIAFCASPDGSAAKSMLYLRPLDSFEAVPIQGTEGAERPFYSSDGTWLGFWNGQQLKKWSVANRGIPAPIANYSGIPQGICWSGDGAVVVGAGALGLQIIDAYGSVAELTKVRSGEEAGHVLPSLVPGGKALLFTVRHHTWGTKTHIEALSLETKERKIVLSSGADARFVAPGHLVFMDNGTLMAVPFDAKTLATTGPAVPMVQNVQQSLNTISGEHNSGVGQFSFSATGTLAYASGGIFPDLRNRVTWFDRDGRSESVAQLDSRAIASLRLSPDGRKLAYRTYGAKAEVWVLDLALGTNVKLTGEGRAIHVTWTNDGQRVTFGYSRAGHSSIYWTNADGSGSPEPELLVASSYGAYPSAWSPDDKLLLFVEAHPKSGSDIWIFRRDEKQKTPLFNGAFNESYPAISVDGRWLAYCSDETGRSEVYVTSMDNPTKGIPITIDGGIAPVWAPDGRAIYYWKPALDELEEVAIETGPPITPSVRRKLFSYQKGDISWVRDYDLSPDGKRFLVVGLEEQTAVEITRLNLVQNWIEELRSRAPNHR